MNRSEITRACLVLTVFSALAAALPLRAQTTGSEAAAAGGLQEVLVTATRREERLQDVPISITAFSQEQIDSQGLRSIDDLTRQSPGVNFSRNGMGSSADLPWLWRTGRRQGSTHHLSLTGCRGA